MKPLLLLLVAFSISTSVQGEEKPQTEREKKAEANELGTVPVKKGLTVPGCMKLQWKGQDKSKLPSAVVVANPFVEKLEVPVELTRWLVEIEYYDPYLAEWRSDLRIPGTFYAEMAALKHGESKKIPIPKEFWFFLTDHVPELTAKKDTRVRLTINLGGVLLRSSEFKWDTRKSTKADSTGESAAPDGSKTEGS